jgi:hypothetical protein
MFTLSMLPHAWAICRFNNDATIPAWAYNGPLFTITRTAEELSIVTVDKNVPDGVKCERGWRCLKVHGPFELSAVGVVASLAGPLAAEGISIFVISTFDTDYVLLKQHDVARAFEVLTAAGHSILD